ncbi:MAG: MarR family transcriptional regulator [Iphinoe sp. HA4291-MV1]|jgi:DNA-binding MarR family transcriptional regulator|nr:MarR family transcriptional regulator [Iphinoe sp. HA4291-MV1]
MTSKRRVPTRAEIVEEFSRVGREHSDATVLFHATMANLLDLHPTDYKALGIIERLGPISAGEIARHSGLATASVTNLIDRLEHKGFVRRIRDTVDRRRVLVEPIVDRVTAARKRFASTRESLAHLVEQYSDEELAVITDFLARNAERLRTETSKLESDTIPCLSSESADASNH